MVSIRLAEKDDFDFFFKLKSEDDNVFWTGGSEKPLEENLRRFFYSAVDNAKNKDCRKIYIIENESAEKVGHLYIIPNSDSYELACAILCAYRGRGYAKQAIKLGLEEGKRLGFSAMKSSIREDNIASLKAYSSCGVKVLNNYREVFIPKLGRTVKMFYVEYAFS